MAKTFGQRIKALLDTYSRCLALLKQLARLSGPEPSSGEQARLRKSLRSARSSVRSQYSSGVSVRGASFETGDAPARKSLRQIVKRLREIVDKLVGSSARHGPASIQYGSLLSLTGHSRSEALRTMSDLSSRVSVASSVSPYSHGSARRSKRRSAASSRSAATSTGSRKQPSPKGHRGDDAHGHKRSPGREGSLGRRISLLTSSSDSTKIGEIRHRHGHPASRVAYPRFELREPVPDEAKRKRRWWKF